MDIRYLLMLQDFRSSINEALTPLLVFISHFSITYVIAIPVIIYWCIDKKKGLYTLLVTGATVTLNSVIKLTACVYRPWVKAPSIVPAAAAMKEATGYSFPSGHSVSATATYGGLAVTYGKQKKVVTVICVIMTLITLFSRNYLGVHTPQDVIVGAAIGIASLVAFYKIFDHLEAHPEKENFWLLGCFIFCVLALIYVTYKPYPMDYVDGQLLVDPQSMMTDGYSDIGMLAGFCIARFIEKTYVKFKVTGINVKGIIVALIGLIPLVCVLKVIPGLMVSALGDHWGGFATRFFLAFQIVLIWPIVIKLVCNRGDKAQAEKNAPSEPKEH